MFNVDADAGILRVVGDSGDNIGWVRERGESLRVILTDGGETTRVDVDSSQINQIIFLGFGGDDVYTNETSIEGLLLGGAGDDTLIGGSGFDQIAGGSGNNELRGNDGNDRLIGGNGNDTIFGGNGDDFVLGGNGTNTINGDAGDDLVFGGDGVDTVFGGLGRDEIFGLAGNDILDAGDGGTGEDFELVLGLDGDDTITAGTGNNNLFGGNGDDTITGGDGGTASLANRIHGQDGDDVLTGGAGEDLIRGLGDNDTIDAGAGNDFIFPGFGDDTVDAGADVDFVEFSRDFSEYIITGSGTDLDVQDRFDIDGNDDVSGAENFRFADVGRQVAQSGATHSVNVQPIIASNSNGSNTAEYFGDASEEEAIQREARFILYQAGVDLTFFNERTINSTFINVGTSAVRPGTDLDSIVSFGDDAGVGNPRSRNINVYFVEVAAGGRDNGENVVRGLARLDPAGVSDNGVSFAVGDNLVGFNGGRTLVARTFAHEIGHNLGLEHTTAGGNLMNLSGSGTATRLVNSQIATIQDSRLAPSIGVTAAGLGAVVVDDGTVADTGGCGCGVCSVCLGG